MTGTLTWICCPQCGEITDLKRLGQVGNITQGALNKAELKHYMRVAHSCRVRCGFCGKIFSTDGATIFEAMGRDTVGDY